MEQLSTMDWRRLFDILLHQEIEQNSYNPIYEGLGINQSVYPRTSLRDKVLEVSAGAINKGLKRNQQIGIFTLNSSVHSFFLDLGFQQVGVCPVFINPYYNDDEFQHIFNLLELKILFVENKHIYDRIHQLLGDDKFNIPIYCIEKHNEVPHIEEFLTTPLAHHFEQFETNKAAIHEDDLATIVLTAGTENLPKAVMLSHKNLCSTIKQIARIIPLRHNNRVVSILPFHHIVSRQLFYAYIINDCSIYFLKNNNLLLENIKKVAPHYFLSSKEILIQFYDNIVHNELKKSFLRKSIFKWSINLGRKYKNYDKLSIFYFIQIAFANFLIFRHWRKAFGGKIEGILVSEQTLYASFSRLFTAAGIDLRQCYSIAECSGMVSLNNFQLNETNFNTVGYALKGTTIEIIEPKDKFDNGKIAIQSEGVMMGYFGEDKLTKNYFLSNDLGRLTNRKNLLQIAGRAKDKIELQSGEKINPQFIESQVLNSPFIENCLVYKSKQGLCTILSLFDTQIKIWNTLENKQSDIDNILNNDSFIELIKNEIININKQLNKPEKITNIQITKDKWNKDNLMLNAFNKKNRVHIFNQYNHLKIYKII